MHEALRIVIDALSDGIAVEETAADALFAAARRIAARGPNSEAEAIRHLARMHRIKALGLQGQIAILRDAATRQFQNRI